MQATEVCEVIDRAAMRGIMSGRGETKEFMRYLHVQQDVNGTRYLIATNGKSLHYRETEQPVGAYKPVEIMPNLTRLEPVELDWHVPSMTGVIWQSIHHATIHTGPISAASACGIAGYFGVIIDPKLMALATGKAKTWFLGIEDGNSPVRVYNGLWHSIVMPIRVDWADLQKTKEEAVA